MNDLYDILELCLQDIEKGTDIETVLSRYPKYADELRPILKASAMAIQSASLGPSPDVERRGRTKVLQQAAQLREAQAQSQARTSRRLWSVPLRRVVVSLIVIVALFISSTRLVEAASTTLPGDNLYPVKRTWEDVRVLFTFNIQAREALEVEHENERLEELSELFTEGRSAKVDFAGTVMSQNGDLWEVAKVPVLISDQTELDGQTVKVGDAVRIRGYTQLGGTVSAERVDVLPAGIPLPEIEDDSAPEQERPEGEVQEDSGEESSGKGSGVNVSKQEATQTPQSESKPREFSQKGVVSSLNGNTLVVNGQSMNISGAKIEGSPKVGTNVKVEGYFDSNGVFVVTKIEFESSVSGENGSINDNDKKDDGGEDNSNEDNYHQEEGGDDNGGDSGGDTNGSGEDGSGD